MLILVTNCDSGSPLGIPMEGFSIESSFIFLLLVYWCHLPALYHFHGLGLQINPWYHLRFSQKQSGKDLELRQEIEVSALSKNFVILGTLPDLCLQFSYLGCNNNYFIWLL